MQGTIATEASRMQMTCWREHERGCNCYLDSDAWIVYLKSQYRVVFPLPASATVQP